MSFYYFFKMLSDLAVIFAAENCYLYPFKCRVDSLLPLFVLAACGALGYYLDSKNPRLRYLSLVFLPLAFLVPITSTATLFALILSAAYVGICVVLPRFQLDHAERLSFLKIGIGILASCVIPMAFFVPIGEKGPTFIPFILVFAFSTLLLTQALRHNEHTLRQPKFRLMTAGCLLLLIVVTFLMSSQAFITLFLQVAELAYQWLLAPILMVVSIVFGALIWLITLPIHSIDPEKINQAVVNMFGTYVKSEPRPVYGDMTVAINFIMVLKFIIGVVAIFFVIKFFVRMFKARRSYRSGRSTTVKKQNITQARSFPEEFVPDGPEAPKDPRKAVRYYYRRFLESCYDGGLSLSKDKTSEMIEREAKSAFSFSAFPSITNIRKTYIKARYSPYEVTREEVEKMKSDCECVADYAPKNTDERYDSLTDAERESFAPGHKLDAKQVLVEQMFGLRERLPKR